MLCCSQSLRSCITTFLWSIFTITSVYCAESIDIDNRLELFVDDHLIGEVTGDVRRTLIKPDPKDVVFVADEP